MSDPHSESAPSEWSPGFHAISLKKFESARDARRGIILVTHPTAPLEQRLHGEEAMSDDALARCAHNYLTRLDAHLSKPGQSGLGLPPGWLAALDPLAPGSNFGWLPIRPSRDGKLRLASSGATASHRLLRATAGSGPPKDETVVLVAGERLKDSAGLWRSTQSGFGLKVVLHLRSRREGATLCVSSMVAHLPHAPYRMLFELTKDNSADLLLAILTDSLGVDQIQRFTRSEAGLIADSARLSHVGERDGLVFDQVRFFAFHDPDEGRDQTGIEVSGLGSSKLVGDQETTYRFTVRLRPRKGKSPIAEVLSRREVLAQVDAQVFREDPASWRDPKAPTSALLENLWYASRPTRDLGRFRSPRTVPTSLESDDGDFCIRNCPAFARADSDYPGARQIADKPGGHIERSDDQSAVAAYHNCDDVFYAIRKFGIDPDLYFRACKRPVNVFYRSGVRPGWGKSGHTVNAWVRLRKPPESGFLANDRPGIELHLALGNLNRRERDQSRKPDKRWAEPLGIANSGRWMMHEFSHVLIAAALGDPEFRFAHSVGDGMAAVWADPMSRLADPCLPQRFRGYTYPWVFTSRRHDRCVLAGWSWSGTFQRPLLEASENKLGGYKGYLSEQIMSTTLFRLYRCLGGDTVRTDGLGNDSPDFDRRRSASRVVLYLILRAIESFGHTPLRAEEFEAAMIDADLGLSTPLETVWDDAGSKPWVGGRAHKVIRWAFEAQGMHPPQQDVVHDAPGSPPPVDIFVADRRSGDEVTERGIVHHGPGSYAPVSLGWSDDAPWLSSGGDPVFQVGNRGSFTATSVSMRIWVGMLTGDRTLDGWDAGENIGWLVEVSETIADAPGNQQVQFIDPRPVIASLGAEAVASLDEMNVIVLIEVSCPDDRANSDPLAGLPTAIAGIANLPSKPCELADLVATDNNLGLWLVIGSNPVPIA
jgi:hypothetical protein